VNEETYDVQIMAYLFVIVCTVVKSTFMISLETVNLNIKLVRTLSGHLTQIIELRIIEIEH
jgi:hypothetical protein